MAEWRLDKFSHIQIHYSMPALGDNKVTPYLPVGNLIIAIIGIKRI